MAKLTIILDKRTHNAQGMFPIKMQICNGDSSTSVSTRIFVTEKSFIGTPEKVVDRNFPNASAINARVKQMYLEYMNAITELDYAGKLQRATAASIKEFVKRKGCQEIEETTFSAEMDRYISTCRAEKTRKGYEYARDMLNQYMKKTVIYFDELTYPTLVSFDRWLEQNGLSINSRGVIFRYIRSVFNAAIKADKLSPNEYPFRKFTIKKAYKEKEFLTLEEMRTILNLDLQGTRRVARDFFMLSFYLCGINQIDLFNLPKADKNGYLVFVRQKIAHTEPMPIQKRVGSYSHSLPKCA